MAEGGTVAEPGEESFHSCNEVGHLVVYGV